MASLSNLSEKHKTCLQEGVNLILKKGLFPTPIEAKWFYLKGKNSDEILINKFVEIIATVMPEAGDFKKWNDIFLKHTITACCNRMDAASACFQSLSIQLNDCLGVYEETLPQHDPYRAKLEALEKTYASKILKEVDPLIRESENHEKNLHERINRCVKETISDQAKALIANAFQISTIDIQTNIAHFVSRTKEFKGLQRTLHAKKVAMEKEIEGFEGDFNYLSYLIAYDKKNTIAQWASFKASLVCYLKRPQSPPPSSPSSSFSTPTIDFEKEKNLVLNLVDAVVERAPKNISLSDGSLRPALEIASSWIPYGISTFNVDQYLEEDTRVLIQKIKTTKEKICNWTTWLNEGMLKDTISDLYAAETVTFEEIAREKKELLAKIEERIGADNRHTISEESLRLYTSSYDISYETLTTELKNYRERTLNFEILKNKVEPALKAMNATLIEFRSQKDK